MRQRPFAFLAALLFVLVSCSPAAAPASSPSATTTAIASVTPTQSPAHYPVTVTDDRGTAVTITGPVARVVTVAPSATEIVYAIGAGDRLVAVDDFSDFPSAAAKLPKVGGFKANVETILSYHPDVIIMTPLADIAPKLEAQGQKVIVLDPSDLDAVYRSIELIGKVLDRVDEARAVVDGMRSRIAAVATKVAGAPRPRVLHEIDASDPTKIYVAGPGSFVDAMITTAGGTNVASGAQSAYPQLSSEEIVRSDPEIIVLSDFQYGTTPEAVGARPGWAAISAVRNKRIYPIDANITSRPGPRLADGVEAYAKLLHPDLFP